MRLLMEGPWVTLNNNSCSGNAINEPSPFLGSHFEKATRESKKVRCATPQNTFSPATTLAAPPFRPGSWEEQMLYEKRHCCHNNRTPSSLSRRTTQPGPETNKLHSKVLRYKKAKPVNEELCNMAHRKNNSFKNYSKNILKPLP